MFSGLLVGLILFLISMSSYAEMYKVTFIGNWDENDINTTMPSSAHFTQLVGATHINGAQLWKVGSLATLGVENVAEFGGVVEITSEVNNKRQAGEAGEYISMSNDNGALGTIETTFRIFQDKPEVTLISMIAPSPDWFVGVSGILLYENNAWLETLTVNLIPWDAGTEEGNTFTLSNDSSNPHVAISTPPDSPFIGSPIIGQLVFERFDLPPPPESPPVNLVFDVNGDGKVNAADLLLMQIEVLIK